VPRLARTGRGRVLDLWVRNRHNRYFGEHSGRSRSVIARARILMAVAAGAVIAGLTVTTALAAGWTQQQKLTASDGVGNDNFGFSAAVSGDGSTALVGAFSKNSFTGAAYVFLRSGTTWSQQAELTAADAASGDEFGLSVSLSGDGNTALIGARNKNSGTGAAYVFIRSGTVWGQQAELTAGDAATNDSFGWSVSLSGDGSAALLGAYNKNSGTGAAYVFIRSGTVWGQQAELTAGDAATGDEFGYSVSISGDASTALVGAFNKNSATGVAYVFIRSGTVWGQQAELAAGDAATNNDFGISVSLGGDGSTALIGADNRNSGTGAAYVFSRSGTTWSQQQELTAGDAATSDGFGFSVSLSADDSTALIGAENKNSGTGAAYVFTRSGSSWNQQHELTASDATSGDDFGFAVSLSSDGTTALVGAFGKNSFTGAAYVFAGMPPPNVPESPWVPGIAAAGLIGSFLLVVRSRPGARGSFDTGPHAG
jgi:hypothetical protein